jgi:hypothetical protein
MTSPHVFVGVTSKPYSSSPSEWNGWGISNNYVSLENSSQGTFGELMLPGATLGVLLDLNKRSISFMRFGDSMCKFTSQKTIDMNTYRSIVDRRRCHRAQKFWYCLQQPAE